MTRVSRTLVGLLLLVFFGGSFGLLAPMTLGRVLLDVGGTQVSGTVTEKSVAGHADRWRGRMTAGHITVSFATLEGEQRRAELSVGREIFRETNPGQGIKVTYWAPFPALSTVEPAPWDEPSFWLALALALLFLFVITAWRTFRPPPVRGEVLR